VPANAQITASGVWCSASGRQVHLPFLDRRCFELIIVSHQPFDSLQVFLVIQPEIWDYDDSRGCDTFTNIRPPHSLFETLAHAMNQSAIFEPSHGDEFRDFLFNFVRGQAAMISQCMLISLSAAKLCLVVLVFMHFGSNWERFERISHRHCDGRPVCMDFNLVEVSMASSAFH
jgi:hypothetical protein